MIRSLDTVALTQFLKDQPTPAMRDGTNRDLPMGTSLNMMVGSNHHLTSLKAPGSKLQASSGITRILTTTNSNIMKKSQAMFSSPLINRD